MDDDVAISLRTLRMFVVDKVRCLSEHDLLQDDSEAVDVGFLSSVDRSSCHTQQLRCRPQLVAVKPKFTHLRQPQAFDSQIASN